MSTPGRLEVGKDGRVTGPAHLSYNDPFPCASSPQRPAGNGFYGTGAMQGVVMHTMDGNLPGTISVFNNPADEASAHFGVAQDGEVHQFGPIGKGWGAWHAAAANLTWYGIEHADNGDTHNPLTAEQVTASAQLVELLSRFAGFPLQVTDRPAGHGYGMHNMGGRAWSPDLHSCPGPGPRAGQRQAVVDLAKQIRSGGGAPAGEYVTDGQESLLDIAADPVLDVRFGVAQILRQTCGGRDFAPELAAYVNAGRLGLPMPKGIKLRIGA